MAEPATAQGDGDGGAGWLRKGAVDSAARLPGLVEAMASAAEIWAASFCALSASEGVIAFTGLREMRSDELAGRSGSLLILAALRAPGWGVPLGLALDRDGVSTVVESFFGGAGDPKPDSRPVTPIEARIVDVVGGQVAVALSASLAGTAGTRFDFERTLPRPDPAFLGKGAVPLIVAGFRLETVGRAAAIEVLFPRAAVDARAALWAGEGAAAGPVLDAAGWTRQLRSEVSRAALRVDAVVAMPPMTLRAVAALRPGQILELPGGAAAPVTLRCGEEMLFRCRFGQSAGFYTVRIEEALERQAQPPRKDR